MSTPRPVLINEIRYAERLCQRTARLYRRIQAFSTFMTVVGGSAVLSGAAGKVDPDLAYLGGVLFAIFGAVMIAMRPGDKAAQNEGDMKRYAQLRTKAADGSVTDQSLEIDLNKARESDAAEIESLRDVAWNDVVVETGNPGCKVELKTRQWLLAVLA